MPARRDKHGRFLKRAKRRPAARRTRTARRTKRRSAKRSTRRSPAPRRVYRRRPSKGSPLVELAEGAAYVTAGILGAGLLARGTAKYADSAVKRAVVIGLGAGALSYFAPKIGRLPVLTSPGIRLAALGMGADALWRASSPAIGRLPFVTEAAGAVGLLRRGGTRPTRLYVPMAARLASITA